MSSAVSRKFLAIGAALLPALTSIAADAMPKPGDARPSVRLVDAWDRTVNTRALGDKPVLVVYEDRDSAAQNQILKDELARLGKGDRYKKAMTLLAIADVSGFDYWPARGFVKDAIKDESRKAGTPIYCDWNGSARRAFGLRQGASNVVLYARDGRVVFARHGSVPAEGRAELIRLLRSEVER
jgi:hypothetical protein